jgi:methionine-rich copper-binding protein CopC
VIAASVVGVLLALELALPVLAHADLVSSSPADKAVLATPPESVTLTFSEDLDAAKSSFKLLSGAGTIGTGQVGATPTAMTLGGLSLAPGDYTIQWTSMSTDQHLLRGTLTFTVLPAPSATASSVSPASPSEAPSAGSSSSAGAEPTQSPGALASAATNEPIQAASGDVILPIIVALALVAGVGAYVLRRSRRA